MRTSRAVLESQLANVELSLKETEARNKELQQECKTLQSGIEANLEPLVSIMFHNATEHNTDIL